MSFAHLPPQPPIYPEEAAAYARAALERSEDAQRVCRVVRDQRFGDDVEQSLDIYLPEDPAPAGAPVLVFAHGGAWTNGYKEWMGLMAPSLTAAGIVFVSIAYRLAPQHKWDVMLGDCVTAIAWVYRNIRQHGGDPSRLSLGGHSAGGHLMALAAFEGRRLQAAGVPRDAIQYCLPLCAPLDIRYPERAPGSGEERTHQMILADSSQADDASPMCHVGSDSPYTLVAYARDDLPRIIRSAASMADALSAHRVPHGTLVLDGDHFSAALDVADATSPWTRRVIQLLHGH